MCGIYELFITLFQILESFIVQTGSYGENGIH